MDGHVSGIGELEQAAKVVLKHPPLFRNNLCVTLSVELQHRALCVFRKLLLLLLLAAILIFPFECNCERLAPQDLIDHVPLEVAILSKVAK